MLGCLSVTNSSGVDGFFCPPEPGFTKYTPAESERRISHDRHAGAYRLDPEAHICVSEERPKLMVEGGERVVIKQGSTYLEKGVTIKDDNTVDLTRRFTTSYEHAQELMEISGFVNRCGSYKVEYSIDTPWIVGAPTVTATRDVVVADVDECTYTGEDPRFIPHCHFPATCRNRVCVDDEDEPVSPGPHTYECVCLQDGFEPDGDGGCVDERHADTKPHPDLSAAALHEAMSLLQWHNFEDFSHDHLRGYKKIVAELYAATHGHSGTTNNGEKVSVRVAKDTAVPDEEEELAAWCKECKYGGRVVVVVVVVVHHAVFFRIVAVALLERNSP